MCRPLLLASLLGSATVELTSSVVLSCPAGSWCVAGIAIDCPKHTYNEQTDQDSQDACVACPDNAESPKGSSSFAACKCRPGYFMNESTCVHCPLPGTTCDAAGVTLETMPLAHGYWRPDKLSIDVRPCPDQAADELSGCGGGLQSCKESRGLSGVFCRTCLEAHTYFTNSYGPSECRPCQGLLEKWLTVVGSVVAAAVVLGMLGWGAWHARARMKHWRRHGWSNSDDGPTAQDSLAEASASLQKEAAKLKLAGHRISVTGKIKLVWGFCQVAGRMELCYHLTGLDKHIAQELDIFAIGNSLGLDGPGSLLYCTGLGTPVRMLTFWVVAPLLLSLAVFVVALAQAWRWRSRKPAWMRQAFLWSLPPWLWIGFASQPIVVWRAFQALECEPLDDVAFRYVPPEYSMECGAKYHPTPEYAEMRAVAYVAGTLYFFCIPLLWASLLFLARKPLQAGRKTDLTRALEFLHVEYKPGFFWWELVEQQRRMCLVGYAVFVTPGSINQIVFGQSFALFFFIALVEFRPYRFGTDNTLSSLFAFGLIFSFGVLIVIKMQVIVAEYKAVGAVLSPKFLTLYIADSHALAGGLMFVLLAGLAVSLLQFARQFFEERRKPHLRWSSGERVIPAVLDEGRYHTFLSHNWRTGQDQARTIKSGLVSLVDDLSVWLDVDDMRTKAGTGATNTANFGSVIDLAHSMIAILTGSVHEDGKEISGYFRSPPCQQELRRAMSTDTPIVWLHEIDPGKGGISLEGHLHDCPEGLRAPLELAIEEGRIVEWHRIRAFQDVSLRLLAAGVLVRQLQERQEAVYHPNEIFLKNLSIPPPNAGEGLKYHAYCSRNNEGASVLMRQLAEQHARGRSRSHRTFSENFRRSLSRSKKSAKSPESRSGSSSGQRPLLWTDNPDCLRECQHFVVYLNAHTHTGAKAQALHAELDAALEQRRHIVLIHETRPSAGGATFASIVNATPTWLSWNQETGAKRLYQELAVPICGGEHFAVSAHLVLGALAHGGEEDVGCASLVKRLTKAQKQISNEQDQTLYRAWQTVVERTTSIEVVVSGVTKCFDGTDQDLSMAATTIQKVVRGQQARSEAGGNSS